MINTILLNNTKFDTLKPQNSRIRDSAENKEEALNSAGSKLAVFPAIKGDKG